MNSDRLDSTRLRLLAMTEVRESFHGRPVLIKHVSFAFYHPAAFVLAQIVADLPVTLIQISQFSIVLYFMSGLRVSAGAFFTYWVVIFATTLSITAMFRAIASAFLTFNSANKIAGLAISAAVTYSGYIIYKSAMHPWFVWIFWINPLCKSTFPPSSLEHVPHRPFRCSLRLGSLDGE